MSDWSSGYARAILDAMVTRMMLKAEPFPGPGRKNVPCKACGVWEGEFHKPECPDRLSREP
jgi:hypothetical protein